MYIVGNFGELNSDFQYEEARITNEITKEDLARSEKYSDFTIININDLTFYNSKNKTWDKLKTR